MQEWTDEFECEIYDRNGCYHGNWLIGFLPFTNQYVFIREQPEINHDNQGNINVHL